MTSRTLRIYSAVASVIAIVFAGLRVAQAQCTPCRIGVCQWRQYTPLGYGTCANGPPPGYTATDFWRIPTACFKEDVAAPDGIYPPPSFVPERIGGDCWDSSITNQPYAGGGCAEGEVIFGSPDLCYDPVCLANAACTPQGEPGFCDTYDASGSTQINEGCNDGEYGCKKLDADDFPVRFASGGRVEINPINVFDATPDGVPRGTFAYTLRYGSHHGRHLATGTATLPVAVRFESQDVHFVGYGFLDNYSDRIFKRGSQYVWMSDHAIITFDPTGQTGQYRSRGNRYLLSDQGIGTTPRMIVSSTSQAEVHRRWTFNAFSSAPTPEFYVIATYKTAVTTSGSDGYGWTISRLPDGRLLKVVDTLGRELRFTYEFKGQNTPHNFFRVTNISFATSATAPISFTATLSYFDVNTLERIDLGQGRYTRFRYDMSHRDFCPRCNRVLSEVIVPVTNTTSPAKGVPAMTGEVVTEGHEYDYYIANDGVPSFRAKRSYGPGRDWYYLWPTHGVNSSVTQLDLHQPQLNGGVPQDCETGPGCGSGFACYSSFIGGDELCYAARVYTLDGTNRNMLASSRVTGSSYVYDAGQAVTRAQDSAGNRSTYAYNSNGDVTCVVHGDDDDSALQGGQCTGPTGSQTTSVSFAGACPEVSSVSSVVKATAGLLGAGSRMDTQCLDGHGLPVALKTQGNTRNVDGVLQSQTPVSIVTYDALGRETESNGPLDDSVAYDHVTTTYYPADQQGNATLNTGRVQTVTRYVGTTDSHPSFTTTYSNYDAFGVPLLVTRPDGSSEAYSTTDRLTWTIQFRGSNNALLGTSTVSLNYDGKLHYATDPDGVCLTYEYTADYPNAANVYVGAPTRIRRSNSACGSAINVGTGEVEIRTYAAGEPDRLQQVERRRNGVIEFTYGGFQYDTDRRLVAATTLDSATPFTFGFTDVLPSSTVAPGAPNAGTWRTDTTADQFGRPTSLSRFLDTNSNRQTYTYEYAAPLTPRPTVLKRGFNGSTTSITTFVYDDFARLIETTVPEAGLPATPSPTRYEYDVADRMIKKRVGSSTTAVRTSAYTYDALRRVTFVDNDTEHVPNCASTAEIEDEEYKYDSCQAPDIPQGFACTNALGRLTMSRVIENCALGVTFKRGRWYDYDVAGRVSRVAYATLANGSFDPPAIMNYAYTAAGRPSSWSSPIAGPLSTTVTLTPDRDTSLINRVTSTGVPVGGGVGDIYVGRNGTSGSPGPRRRGVLYFNVSAAIPAGVTITSVKLRLYLTGSISSQADSFALKRVTAIWGEGTSSVNNGDGSAPSGGDATWVHRLYPTPFWGTQGGDFSAAASQTITVGNVAQYYEWTSTSTMVSDVQGWLNVPSTNNGWIVLPSNEAAAPTMRHFASRSAGASMKPQLVVTYTTPSFVGTGYTYGSDGRINNVYASTNATSPIGQNITYRAFGSITGIDTTSVQPAVGGQRTLKLRATYRTDDSLSLMNWTQFGTGVSDINLLKQTLGRGPAGLISNRTDVADTMSSRFYAYDALLRMTCEARGDTVQPSSSDCNIPSSRLGALFTYGDGQGATSPPDARLTTFIKNAGTSGATYTSPSVETSAYSSGSAQVQSISRTGSDLVIGHDTIGRRTFEYSTADPTKSRRDYSYLPNGQIGTISGLTQQGTAYTISVRYDTQGRPTDIETGSGEYELFWDDQSRLIAVSIDGGAVRWHYHYLGDWLLAATREVGGALKRFWFISDERGLIHRVVDDQGATYWQARWDATGWRAIVGTPQPNMWVPFGLPGQIVIDGSKAFTGSLTTVVRPEIALNRWRAYDPLLGAFLQPDPSDQFARLSPEGYVASGANYVQASDPTGAETQRIGCKWYQDLALDQAIQSALLDISTCASGECAFGGERVREAWKHALTNLNSITCLQDYGYSSSMVFGNNGGGVFVRYPDGLIFRDSRSLEEALRHPGEPKTDDKGLASTYHFDRGGDTFLFKWEIPERGADCLAKVLAHEALHVVNYRLPSTVWWTVALLQPHSTGSLQRWFTKISRESGHSDDLGWAEEQWVDRTVGGIVYDTEHKVEGCIKCR
jgi:YD repeat-containing protein